MLKLKRIDGTLIIQSAKNITLKELVERAAMKELSLRGADLRGAYLYDADLRGAMYCVSMLLMVNWGELPNNLVLELMRHDAESCGNKAMNQWAKGGECPFSDKLQRDFIFRENKDLWKPGKPKLRGARLLAALAEAKKIKL